MERYAHGCIHILSSAHFFRILDAVANDKNINAITAVDLLNDTQTPEREGHLKRTRARFGRISRFSEKLAELAIKLAEKQREPEKITVHRHYFFIGNKFNSEELSIKARWVLEENFQRRNHTYYYKNGKPPNYSKLDRCENCGNKECTRPSMSGDWRGDEERPIGLGTFLFFFIVGHLIIMVT